MFNIFGGDQAPCPEDISRIKVWVRETMRLDDPDLVMVNELRCAEEGCPDVETVIAVMGEKGISNKFKLPLPASQITHQNIIDLL